MGQAQPLAPIKSLTQQVRAVGVAPRRSQHPLIAEALASRDPARARTAMCYHLSRVIDALLGATEVEAKRRRFRDPPGAMAG